MSRTCSSRAGWPRYSILLVRIETGIDRPSALRLKPSNSGEPPVRSVTILGRDPGGTSSVTFFPMICSRVIPCRAAAAGLQSRTLPPMSSIKIGSGERSNKVWNSGSRSVTRIGGILATKRHKIHTRFLEPQRHKDTEKRREVAIAAFLCVFVSLWFIKRREATGLLPPVFDVQLPFIQAARPVLFQQA